MQKQRCLTLTTRVRVLAALAASTFTAGCAPAAELGAAIPKAALPATIHASVDTLADPRLRKQIEQILASPEVRAAQRELIAGIADGALAALSDEERIRRIDALAARTAHAAAAGGVRGATSGLRSAAIADSVSAAVTERIGPAVEITMRDDIGPGLASVLGNEELQRSLGASARVLGREAVLGATEALAQQKPPPQADSLLSRLTDVAGKGARLFGSAAWVLVLVIVLLFAWILKLLAEARRARDVAKSDRSADEHG